MQEHARPEAHKIPPEMDGSTHRAGDLEQVIAQTLEALGFAPVVQRDPSWARFARLLQRWSQRLNLTGHQGEIQIARRLLLDAAALERALPQAETITDLGSGAGIPGIPLAICRPDTRFRLVESRERRHHFQRAAIRELGLENVEAVRGRAETLDPAPTEGVISQAFAKPAQALRWMRPWVAPGGWAAIATARTDPPEHAEFENGGWRDYSEDPARAVWIARLVA